VKKSNIDDLKVTGVRPGVTRRSFSGAGAASGESLVDLSVFNPRRGDYYLIDEGDSSA
jgi:hypothetical protein